MMRRDNDDDDELRDEHAVRRDRKRGVATRPWKVHGRAYVRSITDAIVKRVREADDDDY